MPGISFHVPPVAGPDAFRALLSAFDGVDCSTPITRSAILGRMAMYLETSPRGEVVALARDIGALMVTPAGLDKTPRLQALSRLDCSAELVHGLQYAAWSDIHPGKLTSYWTYRTIVDLLWQKAPMVLDSVTKKLLVEELLVLAETQFANVEGFDPNRVSIGPKSIDGVTRWLEVLHPSVLSDGVVRRREVCPPQLVVLALGTIAVAAGVSPNTDFRLSPEHRTQLCRCCFIELECLDRMLDWTVSTQPSLLRWGTLISTYGRQVVVRRSSIGPEDMS